MSAEPPFRRAFDEARDPYTARNALGITSLGGGAPATAQYITAAADATLTNERVLTNTASITWDFTTPGQAKASTAAGGGNVSNSGTPTAGQYGRWVTATTIQGVAPATVLSDIGAQPLDGDLTAIAALGGTNTIYYRSATDTWSPVVVSTGLAFSGGNLTATGGGGTPGGSNTQVQYNNSGAFGGAANFVWNNTTSVLTVTGQLTVPLGSANSIVAGGSIEAGAGFKQNGIVVTLAPTSAGQVLLRPSGPASTVGQVQILASGAITVAGAITLPADPTLALQAATKQMVDGKQPLDADLTAIAALTGTNTIYYRSAANTWAAVNVSTGLSFSGGNLTATGGGGDVFLAGTNTFTAQNCFTGFPLVVGNTAPVGTSDLQVHGTSLQTARWANNTFGATHYFDKSRGTVGTQVATTIGDFLGDIIFRGSDGSAFSNAAIIRSLVNQAVSTGVVPGALQMLVADATGALALCASITPGACNFIGSTAAPVTGYVGEYLTNSASSVPLGGGYTAAVSMSIPAGDWDIRGVVQVNQAAGSYVYVNLHTGSATSSGSPDTTQTGIMTGLGDCWTSVGPFRKLLTTSTTYYLNVYSSTGSGTLVFGEIQVRRRH